MAGTLPQWLQDYLNTDYGAGAASVFGPQFGGNNPFSQFLQGLMPVYQNQYKADLAKVDENGNPINLDLGWTDWLRQQDPRAAFNAQAPQARGINFGRFAPPVRYLPKAY